jgi:hypothetical protein
LPHRLLPVFAFVRTVQIVVNEVAIERRVDGILDGRDIARVIVLIRILGDDASRRGQLVVLRAISVVVRTIVSQVRLRCVPLR